MYPELTEGKQDLILGIITNHIKIGDLMYAVEFETHIENGIVQVPVEYKSLQYTDAKIIIMAKEKKDSKVFNPKSFLGSTNVSKEEIDTYLNSSKDEWE